MLTAEDLQFLDGLKTQLHTILDAIATYERGNPDTTEWNMDAIEWLPAEGPKGTYEKATAQDSHDFRLMIQDLTRHGDKREKDGYFLWLFRHTNHHIVGRKQVE